MFALDRSSRLALSAAAFAAFSAAYVTLPLAARSESRALTPAIAAPPRPHERTTLVVVPRRDPFDDPPSSQRDETGMTRPHGDVRNVPAIPPILGPLPANAGAAAGGFVAPQQLRVAAVVTGDHPYALVDEAGTTRIVSTGDRIAGATIVDIRSDGVHLVTGEIVPIATSISPNAAPAPAVPRIANPKVIPTPPAGGP
jgi:hypothetical protein